MLRAERIFESEAIAEELEAYNPLIPDGRNLKATMMLEYPDAAERRAALQRLPGVARAGDLDTRAPRCAAGVLRAVYLDMGALGPAVAHADEDLPRSNEDKTSAVHFLRFELDDAMCAALKAGAPVTFGVEHPQYAHETAVSGATRSALAADLV